MKSLGERFEAEVLILIANYSKPNIALIKIQTRRNHLGRKVDDERTRQRRVS
jgi:hypothetical protein